MPMKTQTLPLQLLSPAFLGDAEQKGVWRTPPIKALLREWWRIAAGREANYEHGKLREEEGLLFGNAWLEPAGQQSRFRKSQVRIDLAHWHTGKMTSLPDDAKVSHPEVKFPVGSQLYLGYGPIAFDKVTKKTALKASAALQADEDERNTLDIAYPDTQQEILQRTLQLIDWFGTFGGRSRNGWGSLALGRDPLTKNHAHLAASLRPLNDCLHDDWPHALGNDAIGALIWESQECFADWKLAMTYLAKAKIGFRTHLGFSGGKPHRDPQDRHLLAYPVTNHKVSAPGWGGDGRLANQLRFKLFRDPAGRLRTRIYHTPHRCPLPTRLSEAQQLAVWQTVHRWLDEPQSRNPEYQSLKLQRLGAQR